MRESMKFSAWSIDRIKSGKKTQTRRPVELGDPTKYTTYEYNAYMGCWQFHSYERGMTTTRVDFPWRSELKGLNIIGRPNYTNYGKILVTEFRVEHLQDISAEDCVAEGVDDKVELMGLGMWYTEKEVALKFNFKELWDSIHGENSWELNSLVWVIDFELLDE